MKTIKISIFKEILLQDLQDNLSSKSTFALTLKKAGIDLIDTVGNVLLNGRDSISLTISKWMSGLCMTKWTTLATMTLQLQEFKS
jgi:hypothetical protein